MAFEDERLDNIMLDCLFEGTSEELEKVKQEVKETRRMQKVGVGGMTHALRQAGLIE